MCRLLMAWLGRDGLDKIELITEAFVKSSEHDRYLEKASGGKSSSHDDGWGMVAIGLAGGKPSVLQHRSIRPVFDVESLRMINLLRSRLKRYDEVVILIHSRKASRNEPYGEDYLHPFITLLENGAAWFAHNGGADKLKLANLLGVYPWIRVDSELLGYYIVEKIDDCLRNGSGLDECVAETYDSSMEFIPSCNGFNTGLMMLLGNNPYLYSTHWVGQPCSDQALLDYYKIVAFKIGDSMVAGSITILDYLPQDSSISEISILEPGLYRVLKTGLTRLKKY
ncbi:class II glutamine amidotransferase [Thermosphaera sp.]